MVNCIAIGLVVSGTRISDTRTMDSSVGRAVRAATPLQSSETRIGVRETAWELEGPWASDRFHAALISFRRIWRRKRALH